MMDVIDLSNYRRAQGRRMFEWALQCKKALGCSAEPIRVNFESDNFEDSDECFVSVFYDEENDLAIMRRDWPEYGAVSFNILINFKEIREIAPESAKHLEENGEKMYRYYNYDEYKNRRFSQKKAPMPVWA